MHPEIPLVSLYATEVNKTIVAMREIITVAITPRLTLGKARIIP
jgi:hypothetical protein